MDFNSQDPQQQEQRRQVERRQEDYYQQMMTYDYNSMYQMAIKNRLSGWSWWPIPYLARHHFKVIQDRLMSENEEPVFCFLARINKDTFDTISQPMGMSSNDTIMDQYAQDKQDHPGILGGIMTFLFGWLITPFALNQMWAAFVLTNKNKLYVAHFSWPFVWASDATTLVLKEDDMRVDQNFHASNPYYGSLTIMSLRGNQNIKLVWKRNTIHKIYLGITNNVQRNGKKVEDKDEGLTMY